LEERDTCSSLSPHNGAALCASRKNSAEAPDDGAIKQSLFQHKNSGLDKSAQCDSTLLSSDERFQKSDEWYAAAEPFIQAFFAARAGILWFSEETVQERYTIWNSRSAVAKIR
jgi:hypothetical protein